MWSDFAETADLLATNSDSAPVNSFPRWRADKSNSVDWLYGVAADSWKASIGKEAAQSLAELSGCFSRVHPGTDLKIVSLNTNYWYRQNCEFEFRRCREKSTDCLGGAVWLYGGEFVEWDPNGILTWLAHELDEAENAHQRVWIGVWYSYASSAVRTVADPPSSQSATCHLGVTTLLSTSPTTPIRFSGATAIR